MQFASAESLEMGLTEELEAHSPSYQGGRDVAHFASRLASFDAGPPLKPVTLGTAQNPDNPRDFRVAVRYEQRIPEVDRIIEYVEERAKGETDIVATGRLRPAAWQRQRVRPCAIGSSIMVENVHAAGTIGAFVTRHTDEGLYVLSNAHVLTNFGRAQAGDQIVQPGGLDGGSVQDRVGRLTDWTPTYLAPGPHNRVDAAIARLDDGIYATPGYVTPLGWTAAPSDARARFQAGETVYAQKVGRSTQHTVGRLHAINRRLNIPLGGGIATFAEQLELHPSDPASPFGRVGDSGALVLDTSQPPCPIGLLFAVANNGFGYANPLAWVTKALDIRL